MTGTRQRGKSRKGGYLRRVFAVVLAVSVAAVVPALTPSSPASAAIEIDWYVATPGFVRTNLQPTHLAATPGADVLYAVMDGRSSTWQLLAISVEDFSVLGQVEVSDQGSVRDVVVSEAGAVFVLTRSSVSRFDATDLSLLGRVTLLPEDPRLEITVAHDRPDRFALNDNFGPSHVIYTGPDRLVLEWPGVERIGSVGFGTNSNDVLAIDTDGGSQRAGFLAVFDISTEPTLEFVSARSDQTLAFFDGEMETRGFRDGFIVMAPTAAGLSLGLVEVDPLATNPVSVVEWRELGRDVSRRGVAIDFAAEQYFEFDIDRQSMVLADLLTPDGERLEWRFPTMEIIEPRAPLGDGLVAGIEQSGAGGYLVVASSSTMAGPIGDYHAVSPERLLDTRASVGVPGVRRIGPGETITVEIAGRGGLPDDGVLAVTMNATVTEPTGNGFIKIWPTEVPQPEVSNVNYVAGRTVANAVTVTVGPDGNLQLFNSDRAATHVLLDITGYFSTASGERGARYVDFGTPTRLADTRDTATPLGPGQHLDVFIPPVVAGQSEDPSIRTVAAVLNVTAVGGDSLSFLSVYPADLPSRPGTSTLNFYPDDIRSNSVVAPVPEDNVIRVFNRAGTVDVVVDLFGAYVEYPEGGVDRTGVVDQAGRYYPTPPFRRFDSRIDSPFAGSGALTPGSALILGSSTGWTDILNVTATQPTEAGYLSVIGWYPSITPRDIPQTSNVNFVANETIATAAYVTGQPDVAIVNPRGNTHVVVDVFGYLTPQFVRPIDLVFGGFGGALTAELREQSDEPFTR